MDRVRPKCVQIYMGPVSLHVGGLHHSYVFNLVLVQYIIRLSACFSHWIRTLQRQPLCVNSVQFLKETMKYF